MIEHVGSGSVWIAWGHSRGVDTALLAGRQVQLTLDANCRIVALHLHHLL